MNRLRPRRTTHSLLATALACASCGEAPTPSTTDVDPLEVLAPLVLADGLQASVFAAEPQLFNPVALDVDLDGSVYVAETHRYRESVFDITLDPQWLRDDIALQSVAERSAFLAETFADDPDRLTKSSEVLRRLRDNDGDGRADESVAWATGFDTPISGPAAGVLAHRGEVWLTCIPDLWRLWTAGDGVRRESLQTDFGVHIGVSGHDLHGLTFGPEGRLYFSLGDRGARLTTREGTTIDLRDQGGVLRCWPDGTELEVFATGLRNPQELAFDADGNLWTVDNDTAGGDRSRAIHVVEGGDYGWRFSYQHMAGFGPWVREGVWDGGENGALPNAGYIAQGPSGVEFEPGGLLGEAFDGHLLVCDFPGGVWAFDTVAHGATFRVGERTKLLWELWPTDLAFAPDGALIVCDWVAGWGLPDKGRLLRITHADAAVRERASDAAARLGRDLGPLAHAELVDWLAHRDLRVRQVAQFELASRVGQDGAAALLEVLANAADPRVRLHALWALRQARAANARVRAAFIDALGDPDARVRRAATEALAEVATARDDSAAHLAALLSDPDLLTRAAAARALARRGTPDPAPVLAMLRANADADAYLTQAGVLALCAAADLPLEHAEDPALRRALLLAARRRGDPAIAQFLASEDPATQTEAARAIYDEPIAAALAQLADRASDPTLEPDAQRRAVFAANRRGTAADVRALIAVARSTAAAPPLRVEAIEALAHWAAPDAIDPVTGLWRPIDPRDPTDAHAALRDAFSALTAPDVDPTVRAAVCRAAGVCGLSVLAEALAALAVDATAATPVRRAALDAVLSVATDRDSTHVAAALTAALAAPDLALRTAALPHLARLDPARATQFAARIASDPTEQILLRQAALRALATTPTPAAVAPLAALLTASESDPEFPDAIRLELLDACAAQGDAELTAAVDRLRDETQGITAWRDTFAGGDADRGRKLFTEHVSIQCQRCHAIDGTGGVVGPPLDGIGTRMDRRALADAIVFPLREITEGYAPAMPPGLHTFLSRAELRDLLEYLATEH